MKTSIKTIGLLAALAVALTGPLFSEDAVKSSSSADGTMLLLDKTLVAWVRLADLVLTGSGVLAIQDGDEFDAITFGERAAGRCMAGSSGFSRAQSPAAQQSFAQEAATPDQWPNRVALCCGAVGEKNQFPISCSS